MLKQLRILLILVLFLHSRIGLAINVHYCGAHIAKISWAFHAEGCGMENEQIPISSLDQFKQSNCCVNDVVLVHNETEQTEPKVQDISFSLLYNEHFYELKKTALKLSVNPLKWVQKPPPKLAFYLTYCARLIYD